MRIHTRFTWPVILPTIGEKLLLHNWVRLSVSNVHKTLFCAWARMPLVSLEKSYIPATSVNAYNKMWTIEKRFFRCCLNNTIEWNQRFARGNIVSVTSIVSKLWMFICNRGFLTLPMKTGGAIAAINKILSLYSGRSDVITKNDVVPCECPGSSNWDKNRYNKRNYA